MIISYVIDGVFQREYAEGSGRPLALNSSAQTSFSLWGLSCVEQDTTCAAERTIRRRDLMIIDLAISPTIIPEDGRRCNIFFPGGGLFFLKMRDTIRKLDIVP
jgi:hypothetical protein